LGFIAADSNHIPAAARAENGAQQDERRSGLSTTVLLEVTVRRVAAAMFSLLGAGEFQ
jgi:hypothetical protein